MTRYTFDDSAYIADDFDARRLDAEADEHRDDVCGECSGGSANCPFCGEGNPADREADHAEIERNHARMARTIRRQAGMR